MSKDDSLDPLLRRVARSDDGPPPGGTCIDAETVAAWADGALTDAQRSAAEAHAADCERCLAVVAAMATTAPAPPPVERPMWSPIRWLLPMTAAAVAVTAWLVVRPPQPPPPAGEPATDATTMSKPAEPTIVGGRTSEERPDPPRQERAKAPQRETTATARQGAAAAATPAAPAPPTAAPVGEPAPQLQDLQGQLMARSAQLRGMILSPDPNVRWRLAGSRVERTSDGGATWQLQSTGVTTELLAGASPAPEVAWLVGRSGTVLLSNDGATWQRLDFPDQTTDLIAVTARDARSATVTTSGGQTYTTVDAGRTWTLQEQPAAPF